MIEPARPWTWGQRELPLPLCTAARWMSWGWTHVASVPPTHGAPSFKGMEEQSDPTAYRALGHAEAGADPYAPERRATIPTCASSALARRECKDRADRPDPLTNRRRGTPGFVTEPRHRTAPPREESRRTMEHDTVAHDLMTPPPPPPRRHPYTPAFVEALRVEVACLQAQHPVLADALGRAQAVLLDGRYFPEEDGRALVLASDDGGYYLVNGHCTCPANSYHAETVCKHRLSHRLYQKVSEQLVPAPSGDECLRLEPLPTRGDTVHAGATAPALPQPKVPAHMLVDISGTQFIRYSGLLALAHAAGLTELRAEWTLNTDAVSLASAVAVFADGRTFTEAGDATPENAAHVGLSWRRMSLTRAKARVLRDALSISECSVEERE